MNRHIYYFFPRALSELMWQGNLENSKPWLISHQFIMSTDSSDEEHFKEVIFPVSLFLHLDLSNNQLQNEENESRRW